MNYDVSKSNLAVRDLVFEGCKEVPVDMDFSLPDYCPDIQKILKCRVIPNISSKSISGDRLNIEGTAKIKTIYLDAESKKIRFRFLPKFTLRRMLIFLQTLAARIFSKEFLT